MTENQGPKCKGCSQSEARCAFLNGCCPAGCTHFRHLDANGNDSGKPGSPRTACESCRTHRIACTHRLRIVA